MTTKSRVALVSAGVVTYGLGSGRILPPYGVGPRLNLIDWVFDLVVLHPPDDSGERSKIWDQLRLPVLAQAARPEQARLASRIASLDHEIVVELFNLGCSSDRWIRWRTTKRKAYLLIVIQEHTRIFQQSSNGAALRHNLLLGISREEVEQLRRHMSTAQTDRLLGDIARMRQLQAIGVI